MKCINKKHKRIQKILALLLLLSFVFPFAACGKEKVILPFSEFSDREAFSYVNKKEKESLKGLAEDLCVSASDVTIEGIDTQKVNGAGLFHLQQQQVLYGDRLHERFFPASLTKVLTAYIVLKDVENGAIHMDTPVPISANTEIHEKGVAASLFKKGDVATVEQVLHVMLIRSDNGAAIALAELISGSVEAFVERMNQEAQALGATNSHFMNPHGLTDSEHYSTVYDLYLIFAKAIQYHAFLEIIQKKEYETTVTDAKGTARTISCESTNYFTSGKTVLPEGVISLGGKTGTTKAAGNCLIQYSSNGSGYSFITIILGAKSRDALYLKMTELLGETLKY